MENLAAGSRETLLQELKEYTERCQNRLSELLQELGWEQSSPGKEEETSICPYDSNHRMPVSSLEKHASVCRLRRLGYSKEETEAPNPKFFYEKTNALCIVLDKAKQFEIIKEAKAAAPNTSENGLWEKSLYSSLPAEVPHNHKHTICDLKAGDRLAIYDYVKHETKLDRSGSEKNEADLLEDLTAKINQDDGQKCPKSHLEIMAEMRDYKRRRQSYRAKNVHITKKSYTEIIRDVISVHMEELSSNWRDDMHDEASSSISSSSINRKEQQRSPSVESRQSAGSQRDRRRPGHKRDRSRSPRKRRSRERDRGFRPKKDRSEDKHHSHKRRKDTD
ncbi:PREDICTED: U11/U12 small nuclear ribonucleoprotein 48 kDa protein [Nanorana parkeri]|uniref:U11/U12 small nuclear ribonucleoprotein 48 kDa protein n=1 Tax=Nanorana parkeri TaxID=125878 RepID=UPI000854F655|nr:PREDICTED: U11/U12 small nuclear ribonucleoprotein 48 kDa protein [Nanorana parkeri]